MKYLILLTLLTLNIICFAQKKYNISGFIYAVKLPPKLNGQANMRINILYKGKVIISKSRLIDKQVVKILPSFIYYKNATKVIGKYKLPFTLPPNTYYWLLQSDIELEIAIHPERFKIQVIGTGNKLLQQYELPEMFDFVSVNTININYLKTFKIKEQNKLLQDKTWILNISTKAVESNNKIAIDTGVITK